jgi:hypothetical protein
MKATIKQRTRRVRSIQRVSAFIRKAESIFAIRSEGNCRRLMVEDLIEARSRLIKT